ncbi:hypothetical protein QAD02_009081 [Eretmocerus hayati]|uniref:Uncharacterized protein n=1 Tax=Eretmocerus hayati TaxID=131215 RepID=A0ACC2N8I5_9HYME|nr:hypothetical protein QAD02_009081 [Eretmocerus hayati]
MANRNHSLKKVKEDELTAVRLPRRTFTPEKVMALEAAHEWFLTQEKKKSFTRHSEEAQRKEIAEVRRWMTERAHYCRNAETVRLGPIITRNSSGNLNKMKLDPLIDAKSKSSDGSKGGGSSKLSNKRADDLDSDRSSSVLRNNEPEEISKPQEKSTKMRSNTHIDARCKLSGDEST